MIWPSGAAYFLLAGHIAVPLIPVLATDMPVALAVLRPSNDVMLLLASLGTGAWLIIPPLRCVMHVTFYETAFHHREWAASFLAERRTAPLARLTGRAAFLLSIVWPNSVGDLLMGATGVPRRLAYVGIGVGVLLTSVVAAMLGRGLEAYILTLLGAVEGNWLILVFLATAAAAGLAVTLRRIFRASKEDPHDR